MQKSKVSDKLSQNLREAFKILWKLNRSWRRMLRVRQIEEVLTNTVVAIRRVRKRDEKIRQIETLVGGRIWYPSLQEVGEDSLVILEIFSYGVRSSDQSRIKEVIIVYSGL